MPCNVIELDPFVDIRIENVSLLYFPVAPYRIILSFFFKILNPGRYYSKLSSRIDFFGTPNYRVRSIVWLFEKLFSNSSALAGAISSTNLWMAQGNKNFMFLGLFLSVSI